MFNVGLAATVEFERDRDHSLPRPNICGCDYVYRHISFIKHNIVPFHLNCYKHMRLLTRFYGTYCT